MEQRYRKTMADVADVADEEIFCKSQVCVSREHVRRSRKNKEANTLSTEHSLIL